MTKTYTEMWQWKHGSYVSDLEYTEEQALYWATRATTGGSDDDIAVRPVLVGGWKPVGIDGYLP